MTPLLELRDVHAGYDGVPALFGVDLSVDPGQVVAILGPNGAGKSTTLRVASGMLKPTKGTVCMAGRNVTGASPDELARRGVCTIPEGRGIFPNLTVRENLLMATYTGTALGHIEDVTYDRFPRLAERRSQHAGTLSGGEQQMLAMSRALATNPALLLLDELSMGLAPLIVEQLYEIVAKVAREGVSILVVEQFAQAVLGVADQVTVMLHGRVILTGRPDELRDELHAAYLGS